ncbi:oligosaccharide flippase family protein, partial [Enterococcus faecium]
MILPLITMPYVSRILGPTGLGKFNASFSLSQLFVIFSMLGIQKYGSLIISRDRDDSNKNRKDFYELYTTQFFFSVISYLFYIGVI